MKIIINQLCLIMAILAIATGCGRADSSQSEALEVQEGIDIEKNPLAAIQKVIEIGSQVNNDDLANREPVQPVSFKELLDYLPQTPQGWDALEPEGETNSFGDYSISQVSRAYTQDNKKMEVSIFDWAFNSALYTPFILSTEFSQESTTGYNKGIKINDMPGREEYTYQNKKGSLNLLVNSRFLVRIEGQNIEDRELREWWQRLDSNSLSKINTK
ncbi:MAG: hypothetical protein AAFO95_03050 [Cyanobacteria bacterium J06600_6]